MSAIIQEGFEKAHKEIVCVVNLSRFHLNVSQCVRLHSLLRIVCHPRCFLHVCLACSASVVMITRLMLNIIALKGRV